MLRGLIRQRAVTCLTFFLLGFFFGCAALNLFLGKKLDELQQQKNTLAKKVAEGEERLQRYEQDLAQARRRFIVQAVAVDVHLPKDITDTALKTGLEKQVHQDILAPLLWKEVKTIDPFMLYQVLNGRILTFENKHYRLQVLGLLVSEHLKVDLRATQVGVKTNNH